MCVCPRELNVAIVADEEPHRTNLNAGHVHDNAPTVTRELVLELRQWYCNRTIKLFSKVS